MVYSPENNVATKQGKVKIVSSFFNPENTTITSNGCPPEMTVEQCKRAEISESDYPIVEEYFPLDLNWTMTVGN